MSVVNLDLNFDDCDVFVIPSLITVRHTEWRYVFVDTELWSDGFYHCIYAPYCAVEFVPHPMTQFPVDEFIDF